MNGPRLNALECLFPGLRGSIGSALESDIRDIRPPVELPSSHAWLIWLLGILLFILLAYLLWRIWLHRKNTQPAPALIIPPHVRARNRLREALSLLGRPRPFCTQVSDALRVYLEERFEWHAPDRTTEEFLGELQTRTELNPSQKDVLGQFLSQCDLVKFARHEPEEAALRHLLDVALRLVDETIPQDRPCATGDTP